MRKVPTVLFLAGLGNALEIYDYVLYGVMLPVLAMHFFPTHDAHTGLALAFLSFALSFFVAPLGSIFWGWYGDRFGRVSMVRWSMLIMAFPSLAMACMPTYAAWGWVAPLLLMLCRVIQGLSASGEIMGARIFAMEALGPAYHGRIVGLLSAAGGFGVLLAMLMGYGVSLFPEYENLWRLPFLIGSALFLTARWMRSALQYKMQTPVDKENTDVTANIFFVLKKYFWESLFVLALGAGTGVFSYTMHVFINPFLIGKGFPSSQVYAYSIGGMVCTILTALWAGWVMGGQSGGEERAYILLRVTVGLSFFFSYPAFYSIQQGAYYTMAGYLFFTGVLGVYAASSSLLMVRVFKQEYRCRGVLFNYALGCSLLGGTTPLILNTCARYSPWYPPLFLSLFACIIYGVIQGGWQRVSLHRCGE
jgi:MFS transporter, MHS family, proline/betaine transporter